MADGFARDLLLWAALVALCVALFFAPRVASTVVRWVKRITFRDVLVTVFVLLLLAIAWTAAGAIWAADFVRGQA